MEMNNPMPILENFRANLIRRIDETKETKTAIAKRAGVHRVTLHAILAGRIEPSLELCERLSQVLGFDPPEKIFSGKSKNSR